MSGWPGPESLAWRSAPGSSWRARSRLKGIPGWRLIWGLSVEESTVGRIWRKSDLRPHLLDGFKLSTDPLFVAKVVDVAGLCHNPPEKAVVLCADEKSQVQALDRSQPVLPMMPDMSERRTQVERWFGYLTEQKIRRGVHKSVQALEAGIRDWTDHWNENPRAFAWTKTAEEILSSLAGYLSTISGGAH